MKEVEPAIHQTKLTKSILILDDEEGIRELFRETLEGAGYQTIVSASGKDALRQLKLRPVDLLITDLVMPGQEGIETIVVVRKDYPNLKIVVRKDYPNLKILAISGFGGGSHLKAAQMLGANQTLPKPVDITVLRNTVRVMIGD
jgi:CheY-like chemotaxis protein